MGGSLSSSAKQVFLKYYKPGALETDACWSDLLTEINQLPEPSCGGGENSKRSWKDMLPDWTSEVREKLKASVENDEMVYLSSEDFQLLNMDCLDIESSLMPIVKYFEAGEFDSLKDLLDRIQNTDITLHEWEVELMDYLKRLLHKKKLFDFNRHHFILDHQSSTDSSASLAMSDFFTSLELKILSLISDSDYKNLISVDDTQSQFQIDICRVCCHHKPNSMLNIFSCSADDLSFATKIGICVDVRIEEQDTLPKSICRDCAQNLFTCYEFQKLCRESDYELRRDKTLRDMIMEQVLDKTMGCSVDSSGWSTSSTSDILNSLDAVDKVQDGNGSLLVDNHQEHPQQFGNNNNNNNNTKATQGIPGTTNSVSSSHQGVSSGTTGVVTELVQHSPSSSTSMGDENCDIRKFQCELCGARFFDIYNFKTHFRIHKIVKKYECQSQGCGKKFRTNVMLKIHLRTHTGERPFSCQTCNKTFKTASAVTSHQAVHATVKAFKCDLCPYEGTTKPNLRIHQRTHSKEQPYVCQQCGKRFSTASNLLKHTRNIHQRLKTNKCTVCEKRFFSRESCRKHLITHTDSKPYDCKHCPKVAYSWYSGLEKHYQKYHKRFRMPAESSFKTRVEKALTETLNVGQLEPPMEVKK